MRALAGLVLSLATACAPGGELAIDLHTDLVPGEDFQRIRVRLGQRPEPIEPDALPSEPALLRGGRVIEYAGLAEGEDVVTLELVRDGQDPIVLEVPVEIAGATAVTARLIRRPRIVAGHGVSCVRLGSRAWCWGAADRIFPGMPAGDVLPPTELPFEVRDLCSSFLETCFLEMGGRLRCVGPADGAPSAQRVASHAGHGHVELECGASIFNANRCLRARDGTVSCNGHDAVGQLGDGGGDGTNDLGDDARVLDLEGATELTMGLAHVCAVNGDGEVRCWGFNNGNLGDGTTESRSRPVAPVGVGAVVHVDTSWSTTCAVGPLGTVHCWGGNEAGQIDSDESPVLTPVRMSRVDGARRVAAGEKHVCVLRGYGEVRCWGENERGQLGDGTREDRTEPVESGSALGVVLDVDASPVHTCWVGEEVGRVTVACWGEASSAVGRPGGDVLSAVRLELPGLYSQ